MLRKSWLPLTHGWLSKKQNGWGVGRTGQDIPGADRPRYPHPARIAIAWDPGLVEVWSPETLGLSGDALAPDTELAGLVLGPERIRGQVLRGSAQEAASELAGILKARRLTRK